jgi:hypothetical protein
MRILAQIGLGKKCNPISKITRAKRAESIAQLVEHLPSKSSNPSTTKKEEEEKKKKEISFFFFCGTGV